MKTDDLIAALAADNDTKAQPIERAFTLDVLAGFLVSALGFFAFLGLRQTFFASLDQPRFLFKFIFTLTMAASGLGAGLSAGAAGRGPRQGAARHLAGAGAGGAGLPRGIFLAPQDQWAARMIGHNAVHCLTMVPLMALAPLAGLFFALRQAAPQRSPPRRGGGGFRRGRAGGDALRHELPGRIRPFSSLSGICSRP